MPRYSSLHGVTGAAFAQRFNRHGHANQWPNQTLGWTSDFPKGGANRLCG